MVDGVWRVDAEQREIPAIRSVSCCIPAHALALAAHRKKVCVVGRDQFRLTSSVVETFVQVMHSDTTWPAMSERVKRRVQRLAKRRQTLVENAPAEVNLIGGRSSGVWAEGPATSGEYTS